MPGPKTIKKETPPHVDLEAKLKAAMSNCQFLERDNQVLNNQINDL